MRNVPGSDLRRLLSRIRALGVDPRPASSVKLAGAEGYRLRAGDWRAIYVVDDEARAVTVLKVGHRREVYR